MIAQACKFTSRSFGFGERAVFQCRVDLAPEAEDPYASPEEAASWGSLELWASGRNLTAHYEAGELLGSVSWYLLPFFEWLTEQWDYLFHEQRPPTAVEGDNAWASLQRTYQPDYFQRFGEAAQKVAKENYEWSQRHCMWSASEGGIFPDVVIRRDRDEIEISWGPNRPAGTPEHYFFANGAGAVRIPPREMAGAFYETLRAASSTLSESLPNSARVRALSQRVAKLNRPQLRDTRMAILAGLGTGLPQWRKRWGRLRNRLTKDFAPLAGWFEGKTDDTLVVSGSCEGALMFGSGAPTLRERDVFTLAEKLVEHSHFGAAKDVLSEHAMNAPLLGVPYEDGYHLASEWAETSKLWGGEPGPVDIEKHLSEFGVNVTDVALGDEDIGGVAVARTGLAPIVLVNTANPRNGYPSGRRFTLAHELCHLLYDRDRALNVALISGPWAPPEVERRANAFAARLLMPDAFVERAFAEESADAHNPSFHQLLAAAKQLDVSVDALAHHMANRGYFSSARRDLLLAQRTPVSTQTRIESLS